MQNLKYGALKFLVIRAFLNSLDFVDSSYNTYSSGSVRRHLDGKEVRAFLLRGAPPWLPGNNCQLIVLIAVPIMCAYVSRTGAHFDAPLFATTRDIDLKAFPRTS
jgi:hypothetical protein